MPTPLLEKSSSASTIPEGQPLPADLPGELRNQLNTPAVALIALFQTLAQHNALAYEGDALDLPDLSPKQILPRINVLKARAYDLQDQSDPELALLREEITNLEQLQHIQAQAQSSRRLATVVARQRFEEEPILHEELRQEFLAALTVLPTPPTETTLISSIVTEDVKDTPLPTKPHTPSPTRYAQRPTPETSVADITSLFEQVLTPEQIAKLPSMFSAHLVNSVKKYGPQDAVTFLRRVISEPKFLQSLEKPSGTLQRFHRLAHESGQPLPPPPPSEKIVDILDDLFESVDWRKFTGGAKAFAGPLARALQQYLSRTDVDMTRRAVLENIREDAESAFQLMAERDNRAPAPIFHTLARLLAEHTSKPDTPPSPPAPSRRSSPDIPRRTETAPSYEFTGALKVIFLKQALPENSNDVRYALYEHWGKKAARPGKGRDTHHGNQIREEQEKAKSAIEADINALLQVCSDCNVETFGDLRANPKAMEILTREGLQTLLDIRDIDPLPVDALTLYLNGFKNARYRQPLRDRSRLADHLDQLMKRAQSKTRSS